MNSTNSLMKDSDYYSILNVGIYTFKILYESAWNTVADVYHDNKFLHHVENDEWCRFYNAPDAFLIYNQHALYVYKATGEHYQCSLNNWYSDSDKYSHMSYYDDIITTFEYTEKYCRMNKYSWNCIKIESYCINLTPDT